jgi:lipopolysaccharide export system protein LptC
MRSFLTALTAITVCVLISACTQKQNDVRVTQEAEASPSPQARSEPIFYNGKTYQLDFKPKGSGAYAMNVSGMSQKQEKDAVAVATSSLRYFACPDGQTGKLAGKPVYSQGKWQMTASCGRS